MVPAHTLTRRRLLSGAAGGIASRKTGKDVYYEEPLALLGHEGQQADPNILGASAT